MGREWGRETEAEAELKERGTCKPKRGEHDHHRKAHTRPGTPGNKENPKPHPGRGSGPEYTSQAGQGWAGQVEMAPAASGDRCGCSTPVSVRQVSPGRMQTVPTAPTDLRFSPR